MYTRYDQDITPFLEHVRSVEAERSRQRAVAVRRVFIGVLERCRRVCAPKTSSAAAARANSLPVTSAK